MQISKFFCMLIVGLAIFGFTTVGMASQEEGKQGEATETIKAEATAEGEGVAKEEAKAESKEEIQYGASLELESGEKEAKAEEKE